MAEYARVASSGAAVSQMSDGGTGRPGSAGGGDSDGAVTPPRTSSYSSGWSSSAAAGTGAGSSAGSAGAGSSAGSGGAAERAAHSASPSASAASTPPGLSWPARSRRDMWIGSVSSDLAWLPISVRPVSSSTSSRSRRKVV